MRAAPELPPQLNGLPAIIRRASGAIRVARTRSEASRAVNTAIDQVRKTIGLLHVDGPAEQALGKREIGLTVDTLIIARIELAKATGL